MHKTNTTAKYRTIFTLITILLSLFAIQGNTQQTVRAQDGGTPAATQAPTAAPKLLSSAEGTLTIWADETRAKVLEKIGKDFEAKYNVPVRVQQLGFGDIRDQLKVAGPAGEGPDILIGAHDWLGTLVSNGLLSEIALGDKSANIDPVALRGFTYEGKLYGLPYAVEAIALYYNKDLVPTPPATWDELKSVAQKLQDEGKVDQAYVLQQDDFYQAYPIISGFGGYIFGQDKDGIYNSADLGLDSPGSLAGAKEIDSMVKAGLLRSDITYNTMIDMFKTGKTAMIMTGPWALPEIRKSGINYGVAKFPRMEKLSRPLVKVVGFMVNKRSKNELIAKTFLTDYMATDDTMMELFRVDLHASAWVPVQNKITDADLVVFGQSASDGYPIPAMPETNLILDAWTQAITSIFHQEGDPEQIFKDTATNIRNQMGISTPE
jgi:maltose-binding protein MalE